MPPSISLPNSGGVLSPNQISMSLDQRRLYDRLRQMGIVDAVARQLAVAVAKSSADKAPVGASLAKSAMRAVSLRKKSYHEAFVAAAKDTLSSFQFSQLHDKARNVAGGHASGVSRRAIRTEETPSSYPLHEDPDTLPSKVVKSDDAVPPAGVRAACKRGLDLAPEYGGDGLTDGAKARARAMASGSAVSLDNLKRMRSYFARHTEEKSSSPPSPGYVAWLIWGGDAGKSWANAQVERLEKSQQKPLGAAYSHARAKTKDKKKQQALANKYLRQKGHEPVGKSSGLKLARAALSLVKGLGPLPQELGPPEAQPPKKKKKPKTDKEVSVSLETKIVKAEETPWQRLVYSTVYAPDELDTDGDFMDAETIEKAAHEAMAKGIYINHEHAGDPVGAHVVESYIAPCDMNLGTPGGEALPVTKGSWMMALKVTDPTIWQGVLDGTYGGFSLEGSALADLASQAG